MPNAKSAIDQAHGCVCEPSGARGHQNLQVVENGIVVLHTRERENAETGGFHFARDLLRGKERVVMLAPLARLLTQRA